MTGCKWAARSVPSPWGHRAQVRRNRGTGTQDGWVQAAAQCAYFPGRPDFGDNLLRRKNSKWEAYHFPVVCRPLPTGRKPAAAGRGPGAAGVPGDGPEGLQTAAQRQAGESMSVGGLDHLPEAIGAISRAVFWEAFEVPVVDPISVRTKK